MLKWVFEKLPKGVSFVMLKQPRMVLVNSQYKNTGIDIDSLINKNRAV